MPEPSGGGRCQVTEPWLRSDAVGSGRVAAIATLSRVGDGGGGGDGGRPS